MVVNFTGDIDRFVALPFRGLHQGLTREAAASAKSMILSYIKGIKLGVCVETK